MKPGRETAHARSASGFTIIEVAASLSVFGIIAAGLVANTVAVVQSNRVSNGLSVATTLAQDQIEQLRALDPDINPAALAAGTHADPNNPITMAGVTGGKFTRQWSVTRDSPMPGLSTVAVTVSWSDGAARSVRLTTYACHTSTCG